MNIIKKIMPNFLRKFLLNILVRLQFLSNYRYDFKRYLQHSSKLNDGSELKLEAKITETYHVLEKGLGMVKRREGFGKGKVENLINYLYKYINSGYSLEKSQIISAVIVLRKYFELHENSTEKEMKSLKEKAQGIFKVVNENEKVDGGTFEVTKEDILKASQEDFKSLLFSRHSIRNFSSEEVELDKINNAIRMAQRAPSACNRQSSKVYILNDKKTIEKALLVQNGNRGFGHLFNKLLIVTADINAFNGANERNQTYIDGGMFATSLLYSLHYNGLGTCALNWSVIKEKDLELRSKISIRDSENIIMMIGIGNLPNKVNVAVSQRKSLEEIVQYI